ncbi:MAG: hypothetical protein NC355_03725 [Blautia sp.]|nr:hypothetical protein [Blautia sp.]
MAYVESNCPKCGKKIRENCNAWVYGSPIRNCPGCKCEFLDKRWREVAIDGFDPRANNKKLYIFGFFGFLLFSIVCAGILYYMSSLYGHYPTRLLGCVIVGAVGTIGCAVVLLRQLTGYEDRINQKYMEESQKRLQNKDYVERLVSYGYSVPDAYRNK